MNLKAILKTLIIKSTPDIFWQRLLKLYYLYRLKSYSEDSRILNKEPELSIISHLIKPGDRAIDIGANFGFYTLFLSKFVGKYGYVYSIEPIPLTFEILLNNVTKLVLNNVRTFNCAISDKNNYAIMEIPKYSSGGENFYQARIVGNARHDSSLRQFAVDLKSLDSLLGHLTEHIAFIKIDVEGHELQVINGAKQIINYSKPSLFIEISGNPDDNESSAFKLFDQLNSEGYSCYWCDGTKLRRRTCGDKSVNYFFLTDDQLRQFTIVE